MTIPYLSLERQVAALRTPVLEAIAAVLDQQGFTNGPAVGRFEAELASFLEVPHVVAVNSGTSALHAALLCAGVGPGDEVVTVAHTWISTAWAISYLGAVPRFVDVDPSTCGMDPRLVEAALSPRTRALVPVHLYGQPVDLGPILEIASRHAIPVVEDCAQALGASWAGRRVGTLGLINATSFYPGKNLGAFGEGGAVMTADPELAGRAARLRDHAQLGRHHHVEVGFNWRMDGFQGAVLSLKLRHLEGWIARRRQIAARYREGLAAAPGLELLRGIPDAESVWHIFPVFHARRDELRSGLERRGVSTSVHYPTPRAPAAGLRVPRHGTGLPADLREARGDRGFAADLPRADRGGGGDRGGGRPGHVPGAGMTRLPLVRLDLSEAEVEAAARVIRSGWITQGPEVAAFEAEFAAVVGARHAVALANCTVALELSLRALGVGPGDEVLTVSHSFVATANAVAAVGARPVFVDVEPDTYGMDPRRLADGFSPRTRAVLCVHQIGIPCDVAAIAALCRTHGVPLVEDAACAVGSEVVSGGVPLRIGRPFGSAACFSFHPRKVITTGDGGMVTTDDSSLDRRLRLLRHHGMSIPDTVRHGADRVVFEDYVEPGFNARMTDLQAAVGRPQLRRLEPILARRRLLAGRLSEALAGHRVLAPPVPRPDARWNWQSYPARLREPFEGAQVAVLQFLLEHGVSGKRGVSNAHQEPAYARRDTWRAGPGGLAVSERLRDTTVLLPLFHAMADEEMGALLDVLGHLDRQPPGSS